MADTFTLSGSLADFLGDFTAYEVTGLYLESSERSLTDLTTGVQRVGGGKEIDVDAVAGTWSAVGVPSSADVNWMPAGSQNRLIVHYRHHVTGEERKWESNWFEVTADVAFKDVVQATPTVVSSTVVTNVLAARDEAVAAAETATQLATSDGQTAYNLENGPLSQGVLTATVVPRGEGSPDSALAPLYVDNLPHSMGSAAPTNAATFGAITVTGTAGSKTLTATGATSILAGVGSVLPWDAVLNRASGDDDFFVTVVSTNGSTTLTLLRALDENFTGTLSPKYTAPLDQHITRQATRAYAQHIANEVGIFGSRGRIMAGCWFSQPASYGLSLWARNAALIAYGISNSAAPIVQTALSAQTTGNVQATVDGVSQRTVSGVAGIMCGTHTTGHGCEATLYPGRRDSVLEFWTTAYRTTSVAAISTITVSVVADGETIYTGAFDSFMQRHRIALHSASKVVVSVTNLDGTPAYIYCSQLMLREAGAAARPGGATKKAVLLADSWGEYHSGAFATDLAEKTGATVVNHSLSGMTTEWALDWFDTYVLAEKPDECYIHFFTNDSNNLAGTFTAADGSTKPLWPSGLGTDTAAAKDHWRANILQLIRRCQAAGIKPIVLMPGGTASPSQAQKHFGWSWWLQRPALADDYAATSTELADATAYVNLFGKKTGAKVMVGPSTRTAKGPLAADAWINLAEDSVKQLQIASLHSGTYAVATGVTIGTDTDLNGLSDGFVELSFGVITGDVRTYSIVSTYQKVSTAYAASGASGDTRVGANFTATAGGDYLMVFDVINASASQSFGFYESASGTTSTLAANASGVGVFAVRATAATAGTKYAGIYTVRANGTTKDYTIRKLLVINMASLIAAAPNAEYMSTAELAAFVLAMQP